MAKQTFSVGQVLTAAQMTSLQQTAMLGGSATAKTASYTLVAADAGTVVSVNSTSATTITINTGLFSAGDTVTIQNWGTGAVTITAGTATVNTAGSLIVPQYDGGVLYFTSESAAIYFDFVQAGAVSPLTTKGDLYTYSTSDARLGVGANDTVLVADSSTATGLKWAAPAAGGSMTLLSTTSIVGGGTTTISSINQGYNHLYVVIEGAEGGGDGAGFRINSSVSCQTLMTNQATSSSRSSSYGSGLSMVFYNYPSYDSASTELKNFGYMYFYNYTSTVQMKYAEHGSCYHQNASVLTMTKGGSFWNVTDAITQLVYDGNSSRPETGGAIKVYGIK